MISSRKASSSTTASPRTCILDGSYDVFLSFRGKDTRFNFTDHLYTALNDKGFHTFRDEEKIKMGEPIDPTLSKAIKGSRLFIVIFSKNYAESPWCLNELEEIMECSRKTGRKVYPIFYRVDPSHVCEQEGDYGTPFSSYERNADEEKMRKIQRWRDALREAGNLKGLPVTEKEYESEVIRDAIEEILNYMMPKPFIMDKLVAKESILKGLIESIDIQSEDVCMIGITGSDGIGKTTVAKAICNEISSQFEGVSFLANIRKVSKEYSGLQRLREQLFRDMLVPRGNREIIFYTRNNVRNDIFFHRKVLIFLDDVDSWEQVQFLAAEPKSFGKGSRIIITTIHQEILERHGVKSYGLQKLEYPEDFNLFIQQAMTKEQPLCNSLGLSRRATECCHGLPLALKVLGSFLRKKKQKQWECAVEGLERDLGEFDQEILDNVLRISFDKLHNREKNIFFDVACFFNGDHINFVTKILHGCGFSPKDGMEVLRDRCLLTISDQKVWMHNSIQEVGWEMLRNKDKTEGKRSRLWDYDEVQRELKKKKRTHEIEGIFLDSSELNEQLQIAAEAFAEMTELRVLKVFLGKNVHEENCKVLLDGNLVLSAIDLVYLHWHGYPLDSFQSKFRAEVLLELHMPYSCLKHLQEDKGWFPQLTVLDLSYSRNLVNISNFSAMPKLEKLILEGCTSLPEIDSSIGVLDKLIFLNLNGCKKIDSLPSSFCKLTSLKTLTLSGCFRPEKMPVHLAGLQTSGNLHENRTATSETTSQVALFGLCSLKELDLSECLLRDGAIPSNFWCLSSLEILNLSGNDFTEIPEGITQLSKLRDLQLGYCERLLGIPNLPPTVQEVDAHGCSSLQPSSNFRDGTTILQKIQNLAPKTEFCILLPGSEIPDWFLQKETGYSVTTEKLSPEWQVNLLGIAVCFVFASDREKPEHTPVISCKINDFKFSYIFSCGRGENGFVESDHVWLAYQPRAEVEKSHPDNWNQIKASFEVFGIGLHTEKRVKCAIELIYPDKGKGVERDISTVNCHGSQSLLKFSGNLKLLNHAKVAETSS